MQKSLKEKLFVIIFESDTKGGRRFDLVLIAVILFSIALILLESVEGIDQQYHGLIETCEWIVTGLFTVEFLLRLYCYPKPLRYMFSFFGIVDLLSILPSYLSLFFPVAQYMMVIRVLRALRIFRILKLVNYVGESRHLLIALRASKPKIIVFLFWVTCLTVILGSIMFVIEGPENGFTSIPKGIYWAIVTLTTVGYGDLAPHTPLGQFLASMVMIMGYAIIAVPTGIVSSELSRLPKLKNTMEPGDVCPSCCTEGQYPGAKFCRECGHKLKV